MQASHSTPPLDLDTLLANTKTVSSHAISRPGAPQAGGAQGLGAAHIPTRRPNDASLQAEFLKPLPMNAHPSNLVGRTFGRCQALQ